MNRNQRDANRNTAGALKYAATPWSAQEAWRGKLYRPKPKATSKAAAIDLIACGTPSPVSARTARLIDEDIYKSQFKLETVNLVSELELMRLRNEADKQRADEDRIDSIREEELSRNRKDDR